MDCLIRRVNEMQLITELQFDDCNKNETIFKLLICLLSLINSNKVFMDYFISNIQSCVSILKMFSTNQLLNQIKEAVVENIRTNEEIVSK